MNAWTDGFDQDSAAEYNERSAEWAKDESVKRTLTTVRCVPRYGYDYTQVRTIDVDLRDPHDDELMAIVLRDWFELRGLPEAVYAIDVDDDGFFAIINDEAYLEDWGEELL
ncbi:MAG: hypothetical protein D6744_01540 [Planctomycetota bacterium]|nr:MAG: hypothetical protein D6744_01540 [Planctomycetota bacterium]